VRLSASLFISALALLPACYQQPVIPPDKPLSCTNADAGECPAGFNCVLNRICARRTCANDTDCPAGLSCTGRGCLPASIDGNIPPFTVPGGPPDGGIADLLFADLPAAGTVDAANESYVDTNTTTFPDGGSN
jgi:hypothetical protein